jgi:SpoIIAA-like
MLTPLADLPAGVIGFEASGKLLERDFQDVLLPAIQKAAADGEVRIVFVMPTFEGLTPGAVWKDLKMGVEHWGRWKRVAIVTDVEWMRRGVDWLGWMTPGEVKHFPATEREAAIAWAAGTST